MDGYDYLKLSVPYNTSKNIQDIGTGMLAKALDMNKEMGANLEAIIDSAALERSVTPYIGGNIDYSV